jgi:hypothetical protein
LRPGGTWNHCFRGTCRMVALCDQAGAAYPHAAVGRHNPLCVCLPSLMAYRTPFWRARSGCAPRCLCGSRALSGLLVYGKVPGVGLLRSRDRALARDLGGVCPSRNSWARDDAACGRTCRGRCTGALALARCLILSGSARPRSTESGIARSN